MIVVEQIGYRALLRKEPGGYTDVVPTLQGCISYGDTIEEALDMAREAIGGYLDSLRAYGEDIPAEQGFFE